MPSRSIATISLLGLVANACSSTQTLRSGPTPASSADTAAPQLRGLVVSPAAGERFVYCNRPLTLRLKVDSVSAPSTQLVAGTGQIRGDEGQGRHRTAHEIVYVRSGWGYAVFGNDTMRLGAGSVVYVAPGTTHQFVSVGRDPLDYFWVNGPLNSGNAFRRAATAGCPGGPASPSSSAAPPRAPDSASAGAVVIGPGEGERITYCRFPLTITAKVDSQSVPQSHLLAAQGALRRGMEVGKHSVDEVVLITHGHGRAFAGADTVAVEPGSITWTPRGTTHGFINDGEGTLEYFIVYGPYSTPRSRAGFKSLAGQPGPWCPQGL